MIVMVADPCRNAGIRTKRGSSMGWDERSSHATNAVSSSAAAANAPDTGARPPVHGALDSCEQQREQTEHRQLATRGGATGHWFQTSSA